MNTYKADLHIHTVASPCGDLEMSPRSIVARAKKVGLDIIGIADHNCTKHAALVGRLALAEGIFVMMGAEITTREEAHCLCFLPDEERLGILQQYIEERLLQIPLDVDLFGYQVVVNEVDEILEELPYLLISSIDASIDEVEKFIHSLDGIFIPAHINKNKFSVISQLGFIPFDLRYDALEISRHTTQSLFCQSTPMLAPKTFIQSSDAHYIEDVGSAFTLFNLGELSFDEIRKALNGLDGRNVTIPNR